MAEEICVLPVRCKRCNSVFDLWYDLEEQAERSGQATVSVSRGVARAFDTQSLCWVCREEDTVEEDDNAELVEEFELELE